MDEKLQSAIYAGNLAWVKLLVEGGVSIAEITGQSYSALLYAAFYGQIQILEWLLTEGGASIHEMDGKGNTALLATAEGRLRPLQTVKWLLEHGGANIADTSIKGGTVWDRLERCLIDPPTLSFPRDPSLIGQSDAAVAAVTALLRVMVL